MTNKIDTVFRQSGMKIMTHVVCGYPDLQTTVDMVRVMEDSGADMVEIQIPFTDPMADGPVIMQANRKALDNGTTADKCFETAYRLSTMTDIPLLFMSYANIPFVRGVENFCRESREAGISGLIIPDIPYDDDMNFYETARDNRIHFIPVVSPGIPERRLKDIGEAAEGFIYATLKAGITGAGRTLDPAGIKFIERIKETSRLPVGAGFGISDPEHVGMLKNTADCAIIGSRIISLYRETGLKGVGEFIKGCREKGRM